MMSHTLKKRRHCSLCSILDLLWYSEILLSSSINAISTTPSISTISTSPWLKLLIYISDNYVWDIHITWLPCTQSSTLSYSVNSPSFIIAWVIDHSHCWQHTPAVTIVKTVILELALLFQSQIGFYGDGNNKLYCITHIETLLLWDINEVKI